MWGDDSDCHRITVNSKSYLVRHNLWNFLRLARKLKISDWLWIDAVCIDQSNIDERNHQVQQMAAIYKGARHVLIYPGHIRGQFKITALLAHHSRRAGVPIVKWYERVINSHKLRSLGLKHKSKLLRAHQLPYWKRTWIIQEIHLSKECFIITDCGMITLSRFEFLHDHCQFWMMDETGLLRLSSSSGFSPSSSRELSTLLHISTDSHCSDIRDRLYGLLGLAPECEGFAVDYRRSGKMLFLDFVEHLSLKPCPLYKLQRVMETLEIALQLNVKATCREYARSVDADPVTIIEDQHMYQSFVHLYVQDTYVESYRWSIFNELECEICGLTALPGMEYVKYGNPDRFQLVRTADDRLYIHHDRRADGLTQG